MLSIFLIRCLISMMYLILLKNLWRIKLKKINILCVCNEVGYWIHGLWVSLFVRRVTIARLGTIMKLQECSYVFPKCAKRLVFSLLARGSIQRCDGAIMNNLAVCYARGHGTMKMTAKHSYGTRWRVKMVAPTLRIVLAVVITMVLAPG